MRQKYGGALVAAAVATMAWACGSSSPTTPTSSTATSTANSGTVSPSPPAATPPPSVSDPGGEWNLTTPAGLPSSGCISRSNISGTELDWTVQAVAGHPHRILMEGVVVWEPQSGCNPLASGGDLTRSLQIAGGGGWTFLAGEEGARTISWPGGYCDHDGGRFRIDVLVKRDVPSIGDSDRQSAELLVDCGLTRQP